METGKLLATKRVRKRLADGTVRVYEYPRNAPSRPKGPQSPLAADWARFRQMPEADALLAYYERKALSVERSGASIMSPREFAGIALRSRGRCEITGIPFRRGDDEKAYSPSLDRIRAGGLYSAANCRLVLLAVNVAMSDWGEDVFRDICAAFAANALKQPSP
jgi:hypothetical protein